MPGVWLTEPGASEKRLSRAGALLPGPELASPSLHELRQRLRAIRQEALDALPRLEQQALTAWATAGIEVHQATDAAQAAAIVKAIAGSTQHAAINRSATATKELAPELRKAGFQVTETYYLQLERAQVIPRAFWQLPPRNDADVLGAFARPKSLIEQRRRIVQAAASRDVVGVLGVAAAVAGDGSFHLLQHFANAGEVFEQSRHIVLLVALDKLVGSQADALFQTRCAALFGAEATLLDLSPVASGLPGVPIESLPLSAGSHKLHVILLDNGRRALRDGPYRELLYCIGCRACAVRCPTYREYAGPQRWCPREYLLYHLQGKNPSVDLCVGCTMCLAQCPVAIDIPSMMLRAKSESRKGAGSRVLSSFEQFASVGSRQPGLANGIARSRTLRRLAEPIIGVKAERDLPQLAAKSFESWFKTRSGITAGTKVAYYAGCTARYVSPEIGQATVSLMELAGLEVVFPAQVCCGVPQASNGRLEAARANGARNIRELLASGCDVVTACTTCALALKWDYQHLFRLEGADELSARVFDIVDYVALLRSSGRLPAPSQLPDTSVLYHAPCHLKARGDALAVRRLRLMSSVPGVSAKLVDRGCCGMAGTFGMKCRSYDLSLRIGGELFKAVREVGPDLLSTDCPTCALQLAQGTAMEPVHPVVLLAHSYGLEGGRRIAELIGKRSVHD